MPSGRISIGLRAALALLTVTLLLTSAWAATEKKLHNFGNGTDGSNPFAGLVQEAAGNFYGTTAGGGSYGGGTVFELTPNGSGGWTETKLHNFRVDGSDGVGPAGALIFDAVGNLYGTTANGGGSSCGTVFELTPNGSGGWTEKKLHGFHNGADGCDPEAGLIFDGAGNLYGTTYGGGAHGSGTVFELKPHSTGWTEYVLYSFGANSHDGIFPQAGLIFDAAGNLYGTTVYGGSHPCSGNGCGTVFEMTPDGSGGWTETRLHNFGANGTDGTNPEAELIFDNAGHLYGTTYTGGSHNLGTVFEMTPNGSGGWTEKKLHNFGSTNDGASPFAGVIFDSQGNLYGTTTGGGSYTCGGPGCGTAFEMMPNGSGGWTERKLHNFGNGTDGTNPVAGMVFDGAGNLYGITRFGGTHGGPQGDGTVFEITP